MARAGEGRNRQKRKESAMGTDRKYFPNYINISFINYYMKIRIVIILSNKFPSFIFAAKLHSFIFSSNIQKITIVVHFSYKIEMFCNIWDIFLQSARCLGWRRDSVSAERQRQRHALSRSLRLSLAPSLLSLTRASASGSRRTDT